MPDERRGAAPADTSGGVAGRAIDTTALQRLWTGAPLREGLRRTAAFFEPGRFAVVSAFGPGTLVILHALHEVGVRLPVIFIDTLHHFPETLAHVERVHERYDLDLHIHRPCPDRGEFERRYGPRLWERDLDRYQQVAKVAPFQEATRGLQGWITGRRRGQGESRAALPHVSGGEQVVINPLAEWDRAAVWRFVFEHAIPYNPLHDRGYTSIGDQPLTIPTAPGEGERDGRWPGSGRTECGIHLLQPEAEVQ